MPLPIEQDTSRFRKIVRGKIKQNLRKYMSSGELIGRQGKDLVSIPVPQVDLPRFTWGQRGQGGVGQGSDASAIEEQIGMIPEDEVSSLKRTSAETHPGNAAAPPAAIRQKKNP